MSQVFSIPYITVRILGGFTELPIISTFGTESDETRGNAFALFLKSQRKWDNPALQDDHRDQFRRLCAEKGYDAAK